MSSEPASPKVPSVTLVLGAGVSRGLVPDWDELTDKIVGADDLKSRKRPQCERLPNDNQVRLELAWRALRDEYVARALAETKADGRNIGERMLALETKVEKAWFETLRAEIYPKNRQPYLDARHAGNHSGETSPSTTLNTIVQLLTQKGSEGRVRRVVTFNADDWLEYALVRALGGNEPNRGGGAFRQQFRVVSQPTYGSDSFVREQRGSDDDDASLQSRIPIIHAHGLLCHPAESKKATSSYATPNQQGRPPSYDAPNMLVFRDLDYWRMTSNASSFANHVMLNALSTSRCVFVGVSMRDLNLLRWFGFLASEHSAAWSERWRYQYSEGKGTDPLRRADSWMHRAPIHRWLEGPCDDSLKAILTHRNIAHVPTEWGATSGSESVETRLRQALGYEKDPDAKASPSARQKSPSPKKAKRATSGKR